MIETQKTLLTFWHPKQGAVSGSLLVLHVAMTGPSATSPWLARGACELLADDGESWWYIDLKYLPQFLDAHAECDLVLHDAPHQLDGLAAATPGFDVFQFVDRSQVWDTSILFRLMLLGSKGETGPAEALSPEECINELGEDGGLERQLRFSLDDNDWASAMQTTRTIYRLFGLLLDEYRWIENAAGEAFGFVGEGWYREMADRFGPQTHHIQLRAAIALLSVTRAGLRFDSRQTAELQKILSLQRNELLLALLTFGYSPQCEAAGEVLQRVLRKIELELGSRLERTEEGKYATSEEALCQYRHHNFVDALLKYQSIASCLRLISMYFLESPQDLHPSFDVLKRTGRTSSYGEINAQNLPRDPAFRRCIVPKPGYLFVDADYGTIELVTLAAALEGQFGKQSEMAYLLREGHDLHRWFASCIADVDLDQVTEVERQKAKAFNFGKPGGMGAASIRRHAKVQYDLDLTEDEARELSEAWHDVFPETRPFLHFDTAFELAFLLELTPYSFQMATDGPDRAIDTPGNRQPCAWLGAMCLSVLSTTSPARKEGRPYSPAEINYFWGVLNQMIMELPASVREQIKRREPSLELSRTMRDWLGTGGVITATGRLRANAGFCAQRNTIFQGLAADGAKLALWYLWRAGFRVVNFIHDEFLIEIPVGVDIEAAKLRIKSLMEKGMQDVLPVPLPINVKVRHGSSWVG